MDLLHKIIKEAETNEHMSVPRTFLRFGVAFIQVDENTILAVESTGDGVVVKTPGAVTEHDTLKSFIWEYGGVKAVSSWRSRELAGMN